MNKKITPLEAFYDLLSPIGLNSEGLKRYNLIETELKALEEIDDVLKDYNFERHHIINAIGLYRYFLDNKIDLLKVDNILTNNKEMLVCK